MRLSVVIPVYNEADQVAETVRTVTRALAETTTFTDAEIVVVDDGSSDDPAAAVAETGVAARVIEHPENRGKFWARRTGLDAATGDYVFLLDNGVGLVPQSLAYLERELARDPDADVWNAHTVMDTGGHPVAQFWTVIQDIAFSAYQADPRRTSFGVEDFDRFPKGTGAFFAPRQMLIDACDAFSSIYADLRFSSDDSALIRWIAERKRINIAPGFACIYRPRTSVTAFFRHAVVRGIHFPDSFSSPSSRFFAPMVAFYPASAALTLWALRRPVVAPATIAAIAAAAGALAAVNGRSRSETLGFAAITPVYALGHGLGMWKGAALLARARVAAS